MVHLAIPELYKYLQSKELNPQLQEATQQVFVVFKVNHLEYPLFLKTDGRILQILLFLPCTMQPLTQANMARILHLVNKEIDLPGFGMDEGAGVVFYRSILPSIDGRLDPLLLDNFILTMKRVAQVFTPLVTSVANGMSFDTAVPKLREVLRELLR